MNCNLNLRCASISSLLFQSLIGILMNCNQKPSSQGRHKHVSIPNRDFDELQSKMRGNSLSILSFNP